MNALQVGDKVVEKVWNVVGVIVAIDTDFFSAGYPYVVDIGTGTLHCSAAQLEAVPTDGAMEAQS